MTILVTGATGKIASHLIPALVQDAHPVKAMVRSADKAAAVRELGAQPIVAAYDDAGSLDQAFAGITTLLLLTPPHERAAEWASAGIAAAKKAGVRRVVRISAVLAGPDGPSDNNRQHGQTDAEIRQSGISSVILRPHFFMQNLLADIESLQREGALCSAAGDGKLGMIDVRDIAVAAKQALTQTRWDGQTFDLTGPTAISFHEIAAELSRLLDRDIQYVPITADALAESVRARGFEEWFAQGYHDYLQAYANGWGDFATDSVREITGTPGRSFRQFAAEVLLPAMR
jgi:uncharacterized protein YbjT (DUF2867 family)